MPQGKICADFIHLKPQPINYNMKLILCFLLFSFYSYPNEIHRFYLKENQKLTATFSGSIGQTSSLHFAVAKNKETGDYDVLTFYTDASGQFKQMEELHFQKEPKIVSWHKNENIITIINHNDEKLTIVDFDLTTGKATYGDTNQAKAPDNIFREKGKTIYFYYNGIKGGVVMAEYTTTKAPFIKNYSFKTNDAGNYKTVFKKTPEAIDLNEYISNGSIADYRSYLTDRFLVVTADDKATGISTVMSLNRNNGEIAFKALQNKLHKQQDLTTFVTNDMVFSMAINEIDMALKIYDLATGDEKKSYTLKKDFSQYFQGPAFEKNFFEQACKNIMKPTLAVNYTNDGLITLRIDVVEKSSYTYDYNYDWFRIYMWQNQMMQSQQNYLRGPSAEKYKILPADYKDPKTAFTLVFNKELQLLGNSNVVEGFIDINKASYINRYRGINYLANFTATFLKDEMRYIYQHKDNKMIFISSTQYM